MSKKTFKTSFDDFIGVGREEHEVSQLKKPTKESYEEIRATFVVRKDHADKLKYISYAERKMIKEIIAEIFEEHIRRYEEKNAPIQLPKSK